MHAYCSIHYSCKPFLLYVAITQEYIASCGVVHRDLACCNLLLALDNLVKIADFGFACTLDGRQCIVKDLPAEKQATSLDVT